MQKRSSKSKKSDINELARLIVDQTTNAQPEIKTTHKDKNPAAVALGRLGGLKGGKARAEKLSKRRLRQIAQNAAKARWKKQNQSED